MKILPCTHCQWFIADERNLSTSSRCGHPDHQKIDYITGKTEPYFCINMRSKHMACGPEGNLWAYDDAFPPVEGA